MSSCWDLGVVKVFLGPVEVAYSAAWDHVITAQS